VAAIVDGASDADTDIALALVPITLALSAIALVFRTAAAFLVGWGLAQAITNSC
jgi:hypothetical protein